MGNVIVTTGRRNEEQNAALAKEAALFLSCPFIPRGGASIESVSAKYNAQYVIVAREGRLTVETGTGLLFFHPGVAHLRLKNLRQRRGDHLADALALAPGMRVLDATAGLCADSIVISFVTGAKVTALEVNPVIAAIVKFGLASVSHERPEVCEAMRRIEVVRAEHLEYMRKLPDNSFDAVFFDPMFRHPFHKSSGMNPLRGLSDPSPLSEEAVEEARRVARYRVVMKETSQSGEFERLGFKNFAGGKYSHIRYGIIQD